MVQVEAEVEDMQEIIVGQIQAHEEVEEVGAPGVVI
jgi:hypothetical protein